MNPPRAMLAVALAFSLGNCAGRWPAANRPGEPVEPAALRAELADPRLLQRLGVEGLTILESETYRVVIGDSAGGEPLGVLYYTLQDGWHLKTENEVMKFLPRQGWQIGER